MPPNGQGLTALVMLNILETFDLASLEPLGPERFHLMLEAARMAYAVRDTHIADPAHMRVAVGGADRQGVRQTLAAKIDRAKRVPLPTAPTPGSDTVYLTVVDRDRKAVSFINSLYSGFGVGICSREDRRDAQQPRRRLRARSRPSEHARARASGRCTPSSRRWRCGTAAAT